MAAAPPTPAEDGGDPASAWRAAQHLLQVTQSMSLDQTERNQETSDGYLDGAEGSTTDRADVQGQPENFVGNCGHLTA